MENRKTNIIDFLSIIVKWRRLIVINFIVICMITAMLSLTIPKTFTAKTTILPPIEKGEGFGLSSLIGNLPLAQLGLSSVSEETYTFIAILNSRTVMEAVAEKFNLMELYGAENMEQTVKALRENVNVEINEDATIGLSASAQTGFLSSEDNENEARKLARDIANAFIEELERVNSRLKTEKARNNRIFIEKRYRQNLADLQKAENELRRFQETHGVIAMTEQTEAAIQAAAELKARITVKEIEVAVLSQYVSSSHTDLTRAKSELNELKIKFDEMKTGKNYDFSNDQIDKYDSKLFFPLNEVPELGLQYIRLYREVTLQQKILEFLLPQYEQAKIQEAKDTPTVQVLDEAIIPIKRAKPKRAIMVILAGLLSIGFSIIGAFLIEYVRNLEATKKEDYLKLEGIFQSIRGDIRKLVHKKSKTIN